ncbi:DUF5077 domain-containing protein [Ancylomarina euxinus]|uniref:DUF5077 domain-containing protein n=1 Tax=Ancylomarina euxinus TaxID=2283627 RepID=A0A425XX62_9BACT|nr:DUF3472 domain-containing protein [Ancylomarina euxinus]MCZ4696198.1 DUF5077 domain-containing protein [Ancylomarina euxinus]MUP16438.1 DUF5077 domain-containing protein [Ancylomarina euxinus]RRG19227.1 DUF5077 domain-containing protein [Ancylomarina euxinus]
MKINRYSILVSFILVCVLSACSFEKKKKKEEFKTTKDLVITVPLAGNAWVVNDVSLNERMISDKGLTNWNKESSVIRTFVRVNGTGQLSLGVKAKSLKGSSTVRITIGEESKEITISNKKSDLIPVGYFDVPQNGYVQIDMQGVSKTDQYFAEVSQLVIGGKATSAGTDFVKDDFYWGRRGPSVHLSYKVPEEAGDIRWFYNEIEVPEGNDVIGSYFMANGFGEGYFGIQVNSETERRVLFSVWSPYVTDNPNDIPDDEKITLLKKGAEVKTGEFGNEGSGGQSYRVYNWRAGNKYRFILGAKPSVDNSTDYTAYFFAPEIGKWELIASFRRPKTSTYLTRPHSFLENFMTEMGQFTRMGTYSNQWLRNTEGKWFEIKEAKFTADATARKNSRLDYAGGVDGTRFFLKNCGFFSDRTIMDTYFKRESIGKAPLIDFENLP